jgi:hypothetical protein
VYVKPPTSTKQQVKHHDSYGGVKGIPYDVLKDVLKNGEKNEILAWAGAAEAEIESLFTDEMYCSDLASDLTNMTSAMVDAHNNISTPVQLRMTTESFFLLFSAAKGVREATPEVKV